MENYYNHFLQSAKGEMINSNTYVVIMAGGIGSRFWPASRTAYPKQFLDILGTGRSLIQQTFDRFHKLVPADQIYVITSKEYNETVAAHLPQLPVENIVGEPARRNTAPCIAYIAYKLKQQDPEAVMIVAPADHSIADTDGFTNTCKKALDFVASNDALVTLGIQPTHPNTGYGYIQREKSEVSPSVYKVKQFTEKPGLETAKVFIESGDFYWNAGIFTWKAGSIIEAIRSYLPDLAEAFEEIQGDLNTPNEPFSIGKVYSNCKNISIDFGVMEKAENVYVIPAAFDWSDLGTWNSAWENMEKDASKNAVSGDNIVTIAAEGCLVHIKKEKLVLLEGLEDYIVVDTEDVLLICRKESEQKIKEYVADIKRTKGDRYL